MLETIERYYKNISGIEAQVKDKIEKLKNKLQRKIESENNKINLLS